MKIRSFQQQGQRPYQEDAFFADETLGLFLVCDGVGGRAGGDLAARLVIKTITYAVDKAKVNLQDPEMPEALITEVQKKLSRELKKNNKLSGMATTLALLFFHPAGAVAVHVGDSRIFWLQTRQGRYWRTKDHSLVQELADAGVIREEDMQTHPRKNVITRALYADPSPKKIKPSVQHLHNLQAGDLFVLCTDGVLEPFTEREFISTLANPQQPIEEKSENIRLACEKKSRDNNTAIFVELTQEDICLSSTEQQPSNFPWKAIP